MDVHKDSNGTQNDSKGFLHGFSKDFKRDSMEIQWDFKGFLKGLHKDGFHRIAMMILRDVFKDAISISIRTHELGFWIPQMCIPSPLICN